MSDSAFSPSRRPFAGANGEANGPERTASGDFLDAWSAERKAGPKCAERRTTDAPTAMNDPEIERRRSRRRFTASLAIGLLSLTASSAWVFDQRRHARGEVSDRPLLASEVVDFEFLDHALETRHEAGIQAVLQAAPTSEVATITKWIAMRQHASLYDTLVGLLASPAFEVRVRTLTDLKTLPAVALKPHLSAMMSIASFEPDPDLRSKIEKLIRQVQNS